ncbi:MAG: peptidoglycan editing factor PgeF [Oscillospiraceae bacterium]
MSFITHRQADLTYLTASGLDGVPHGFSTRPGGVSAPPFDSLNLGIGRGDAPEAVAENYRRFCAALGVDEARTVLSKQIHEDSIRTVTEDDAGKGLLRPRDYTADGLMTDVPDLPLVVFSADCGILLLSDPVTGAVAAVHAGWRGTASGIVGKAVRALQRVYGARPENLRAAIGPCIDSCCFETDDDVPAAMHAALGSAADPFLKKGEKKWQVDLKGLNRHWLLEAGVLPTGIDVCPLCTACHPELFWSHRKMGEGRGAQIALIAAVSGSPE